MNYSNMIKTEDTASMYHYWSEYRQNLTAYIINGLKEYCRKGSCVAIWGAGGCNDIEIMELVKDYKLLLIDQDTAKLEQLRERLGLSMDICRVVDVGFWKLSDEDYEMFQALLMDGASYDELKLYFQDVINNMQQPISLENYSVDCSVVVGLASQLNARFVALLHLYKEKLSHIAMEDILGIISNMNQLAVERLFVSIRQITRTLIITGYESCGCYSIEDMESYGARLSQAFEEGIYGGSFLSERDTEAAYIRVAGNEFWHRLIKKALIMDKLEDVGMCRVLNWTFTKEKFYPMLMVTLLVR